MDGASHEGAGTEGRESHHKQWVEGESEGMGGLMGAMGPPDGVGTMPGEGMLSEGEGMGGLMGAMGPPDGVGTMPGEGMLSGSQGVFFWNSIAAEAAAQSSDPDPDRNPESESTLTPAGTPLVHVKSAHGP